MCYEAVMYVIFYVLWAVLTIMMAIHRYQEWKEDRHWWWEAEHWGWEG